MITQKIRCQDLINIFSDVLTILLSYILAVYIRYEIMPSKPGLNTLSAPYLLIATAYSLILASVFQFIRKARLRGNVGYGVLPINAIGCLFLLAFLYTIGELYFSRLALIMFWLISSILLEIKWMILFILFNKKYRELTKDFRVLLVGGGEVTNGYIRSIGWDEACNFNIIGYVGKQYGIFYDYPFDGEEADDEGDLTARGWLGNFEQLEDVIERLNPDEVVFALEDEELYRLQEMISIVKNRKIKASIVPSFNKIIPQDAIISKVNDISIIDLSGSEIEESNGIYAFGLTLTGVFLLLMLIIKRFRVGNFDSFGLYENYRCFIFSVAAFFVFQCLGSVMKKVKHAHIISAIITMIISLISIVLYELIYTQGVMIQQTIISDIRMTVVVVAVAGVVKYVLDMISSDSYWNMF